MSMVGEPEPDRSLNMFCPHCASWYASNKHPHGFRKLEVSHASSSGVREVFYCTIPRDLGVELIDAATHGTLTPWEEWTRDHKIQEMENHKRQADMLLRELNDYFMYENGRGM